MKVFKFKPIALSNKIQNKSIMKKGSIPIYCRNQNNLNRCAAFQNNVFLIDSNSD